MTKYHDSEKIIETSVCMFASIHGWSVYKFVSPNNRGVPDRLFMRAGTIIFIEFKATGKKAKPLQQLRMNEIEAQGFRCYVVDNIEMGKDILK